MEHTQTNVIEVKGLTLTDRSRKILDDVDLTIPSSAIYCLAGPAGAGKTSLFRAILRLIKPSSGQVTVFGSPLIRRDSHLFQRVGYAPDVPQYPGGLSVRDFMQFVQSLYPNWDDVLYQRLLERYALCKATKVRDLSRGEITKLSFLSLLPAHPSLLILDEPFASTDPRLRNLLIEDLLDASADCSIIFSCHNLGQVESFVTHLGVFVNGRMALSGDADVLRQRYQRFTIAFSESLSAEDAETSSRPANWIAVRRDGRFLDVVFDRADSDEWIASIYQRFGTGIEVTSRSMSLEDIYTAHAQGVSYAE